MEVESEESCVYKNKTQLSTVFNNLNEQRLSSRLCDVILQIFDDQISAHSNVLAAASPYFDKLFDGQELPRVFSQKSPQIIEIHIDGPRDLGYNIAVRRVVDFMYTSKIELDVNILTQVVEIAKIMQMDNVLDFCQLYTDGCMDGIENSARLVNKECQTAVEEALLHDIEGYMTGRGFFGTAGLNKSGGVIGPKRKRGRPRKEVREVDSDEKENHDEGLSSSVAEPKKEEDCWNAAVEQPLKVSRSGRIIKPKVFSDDLLSDVVIKKELFSDEDDVDMEEDIPEGVGREPRSLPGGLIRKDMCSVIEQVKTYSCDKCDYTTIKVKDFNDHYKEHLHAERKCSYCGWTCEEFSEEFSQEQFDEHLKRHTGDLPFFCNFCSARFKTRTKFLQHVPKHLKQKPFVCEECGAAFKWKHALKNHMIIHKNSKDYLCDICGFSTAHKAQLKSHRLIHTGDTFKCSVPNCNYQATKKTNLQFHMMTHTREKPHQCEVCGTSFSLEKNMKRHMLLHRGERPFKCELCSFCTTRFDKLKEHYFKQHCVGEKPGKKLRVTDYLKSQEEEDGVKAEMHVEEVGEQELLGINGHFETFELEVADTGNTTQIVNVTSSTGEQIPIAISGSNVSYEIPVQFVSQEIATQDTSTNVITIEGI